MTSKELVDRLIDIISYSVDSRDICVPANSYEYSSDEWSVETIYFIDARHLIEGLTKFKSELPDV